MEIRKYDKKDKSEVKNIFTLYWNDEDFLDELIKELDSYYCNFYVAQEKDEIVGISGFRKIFNYLSNYIETDKPVELYIIASKYRKRGIGYLLVQKVIEEAKKSNFTEILCYSPETHNSSWRFYEKLKFIKYDTIIEPDDGYPGIIWKKKI